MRAPLSVLAPQRDQCTHALLPFSTAHSLTHRFASLRAPCSQTMAHDLERIHVLRRDRRHLRRRLRRHLCRRATPALDPLDPVLDPAQRTEGGVDAVRPRRRSIGSASTAATSAPPAPSAPPSSSPSLSRWTRRSKPNALRVPFGCTLRAAHESAAVDPNINMRGAPAATQRDRVSWNALLITCIYSYIFLSAGPPHDGSSGFTCTVLPIRY